MWANDWICLCGPVYICLCVKGFLYVSPHHQGSQGKMAHPPTSCQTLGSFFWITAAPSPLQSLCKYCILWHVYWVQSWVCACLQMHVGLFMVTHGQLLSINGHVSLSGEMCWPLIIGHCFIVTGYLAAETEQWQWNSFEPCNPSSWCEWEKERGREGHPVQIGMEIKTWSGSLASSLSIGSKRLDKHKHLKSPCVCSN